MNSESADPRPIGCPLCVVQDGHGLQRHFVNSGDETQLSIHIPRRLQGYPGIAHGGYIAFFFDEVIGYAVGQKVGGVAVTRSLQVDYERPVPVEVPIIVVGTYDRPGNEHHLHRGRGTLYDAWGTRLAQGEGLFLIGSGRTIRRLLSIRSRPSAAKKSC